MTIKKEWWQLAKRLPQIEITTDKYAYISVPFLVKVRSDKCDSIGRVFISWEGGIYVSVIDHIGENKFEAGNEIFNDIYWKEIE